MLSPFTTNHLSSPRRFNFSCVSKTSCYIYTVEVAQQQPAHQRSRLQIKCCWLPLLLFRLTFIFAKGALLVEPLPNQGDLTTQSGHILGIYLIKTGPAEYLCCETTEKVDRFKWRPLLSADQMTADSNCCFWVFRSCICPDTKVLLTYCISKCVLQEISCQCLSAGACVWMCHLFSCVSGVRGRAKAAAVERPLTLRPTLLLATKEEEEIRLFIHLSFICTMTAPLHQMKIFKMPIALFYTKVLVGIFGIIWIHHQNII